MCGGLALAAAGEGAAFSPVGLALVLGAGCLGGLRWSLTQLLVQARRHWACRVSDAERILSLSTNGF